MVVTWWFSHTWSKYSSARVNWVAGLGLCCMAVTRRMERSCGVHCRHCRSVCVCVCGGKGEDFNDSVTF